MAGSMEAQRIVAVSLGKIAASRSTRSGIRLHKSLMVSTMLYKARTVVIMEKFNGPFSKTMDEDDDESSSLESREKFADCEQAAGKVEQTTDLDDYDDDETDEYGDEDEEFYDEDGEQEVPEIDLDAIRKKPKTSDAATENKTDNGTQNSETKVDVSTNNAESIENNNNKENSNISDSTTEVVVNKLPQISTCLQPKPVLKSCENTTHNLDSQVITKCERCTKRRLTEVESEVETITSPTKKSRQSDEESDEANVENEENASLEVPMDGVQITHLVDSFSSGFSGLVGNNNGNTTTAVSDTLNTVIGVTDSLSSVIEQCGYKHKKSSGNSTNMKGHGLSEAFNHCSTQIKESFEALASPIALSV